MVDILYIVFYIKIYFGFLIYNYRVYIVWLFYICIFILLLKCDIDVSKFFLLKCIEDGEGIRLGGYLFLNIVDEVILYVIVDDFNY